MADVPSKAGTWHSTGRDAVMEGVVAAIEWIRRAGFDISSSRWHRYLEMLRHLEERRLNPQRHFPDLDIPLAHAAVYETHDLVQIHSSLSGLELSPWLVERLGKIYAGPLSPAEENPNRGGNESRNYMFELLVAGRLHDAGYRLRTDISSDVAIDDGDGTTLFVIQCKRPQNTARIDDLIRQAARQIENGFQSPYSQPAFGLIAIDISKAINPRFKKLQFDSPQAVEQILAAAVGKFEQAHRKRIRRYAQGHTLAVLVRACVLGSTEPNNSTIAYMQQYGVIARAGLQPALKNQLFEMHTRMLQAVGARKR